MLHRRLGFTLFVLLAVSAMPAFAQDKKLGLLLAYPTALGVQWTLNDRIALRGDGTVRWSSTAQDPSTPQTIGTLSLRSSYESDAVSGTIGVSALITLSNADRFKTYLSPRIAWTLSRTTTTISYDLNTIQLQLPEPLLRTLAPRTLETNQTTPTVSGVFGASVAVHDRLSLFAEAGAGYSWDTLSQVGIGAETANSPTRTKALALRSGIGAIVYF